MIKYIYLGEYMNYLMTILFLFQTAAAQVTVVEDSLVSKSLNTVSKFYVILPEGYKKHQDRYPVLYLLHGLGGDYTNWVKLTNIVRYAKEYRMIIVTPDAGNGWYTNSPFVQNAQYEDYIITEMIPTVEKRYRTIQTKFHRAIAGLSMGGYGAIKFGLKYPGKFFFIGGFSPSIQFPGGLEDSAITARWSRTATLNLRELFGQNRTDSWNENDIFFLTERSNGKSLPYFYLSVGSQDGISEIIGLTHDLAASLRKKGISFEMHESAGSHDWKFWDQEIKTALQRIAELSGKRH
ncbi:MAG: alpha/beta hydrolase family protein [Bacteriovoracaceae bacterium]|nr:esterase family protein [Bacteroidota bacterium]